ncbi:DUF2108 domain-containing protein [Methanocaldococcus indicus]|uniref:DUF2108 domain-containing protein n=1 Tax=Methanocaldococcus indicus TaxID=213231 RepID=UPI003C6D5388
MDILFIVSALCCIFGGIGTILHTNPINKLIMLSLMETGIIGFIAYFYYLDVAILLTIVSPITNIIILVGYVKYLEINKEKKKVKKKEFPILGG